ncbi:MAG: type III-B CRISPR module-associated protein Cmr5 [Persicimonas sp.]
MSLRDQQRALHAYEAVAQVQPRQRKDYQIAVNDLGANILRSGLCAAMASVQRLGNRGDVLLGHLASARVPGLEDATAHDIGQRVRGLDADSYMIATRELLQVATWLKRAVQAIVEET